MLKTRVTLENISLVLLNLFKRLILVNVQRLHLPPDVPAFNIHIFSLIYQLQLILTLTLVPFPIYLVCVMICTFDWEEFIYGTFEDCIVFLILTIATR